MVDTKTKIVSQLGLQIVFIYFVLFPFGQLLRIEKSIFGYPITFHPLDFIVGLSLIPVIFESLKIPKIFKIMQNFLIILAFSLLISLAFHKIEQIIVGFLYFLRVVAYSSFCLLIWNIVQEQKQYRQIFFNALISICLFTAIFGWIQYFWIPNLISLKYIGWDDHLNRLVGTFLDPGFTSIILVLGFLATFLHFLKDRRKYLIFFLLFFLVTIAFTYARAAYLALLAGLMSLFIFLKKDKKGKAGLGLKKTVGLMIGFFVLVVIGLPRTVGEGVKLERTSSIYARLRNYNQTVEIISKNSLFGVGFNNLCLVKTKLFRETPLSHSCGGSDSSLLFIFATTGIIGLVVFANMVFSILKTVKNDIYGKTFLACSSALLVHSLFVQSLFYPWVMGWMGILLAISIP